MADNEGKYVSTAKMLGTIAAAGLGESTKVVLSAKTLVLGTKYSFTWSGPTGYAPVVGDFLTKGDAHATVTAVSGATLEADDATDIDGVVRAVRTDLLEEEIDEKVDEAMAFIDRHTRQWFNKRTFDDANPVRVEGNNSRTLFFPVPIIEVTSLRKNGPDAEVLDPTAYEVFRSRALPDDRRNPMIKLMRDSDSVLYVTAGQFLRGQITYIEGAFGYLEPDGSTPKQIQRATAKLATMYLLKSVGESAEDAVNNAGVGPIKREKTDLHEIEYFDASKSSLASGSGLSGDDEIDDIIAAFKGPIIVSGTYPDFGTEAPYLSGINTAEDF